MAAEDLVIKIDLKVGGNIPELVVIIPYCIFVDYSNDFIIKHIAIDGKINFTPVESLADQISYLRFFLLIQPWQLGVKIKLLWN